MKKISSFCLVSILLMVLAPQVQAAAFSGFGPATAQQQQDDPKPTAESAGAVSAQVFTGKVMKDNGQWTLVDKTTKSKYLLDDGEKAKEHQGKMVTITGTLDLTGKVIHIADIQDAD